MTGRRSAGAASAPACSQRFTTIERVQLRELTVVKSDGRRVPFDRDKLARSVRIALRKRPVQEERIERIVNGIVRQLEASGESDIPSKQIGELVMETLKEVDAVAYVRFASVYRNFREAKDFEAFLGELGRAHIDASNGRSFTYACGPGPGTARPGQCLAQSLGRLRGGARRARGRPRRHRAGRAAACRAAGARHGRRRRRAAPPSMSRWSRAATMAARRPAPTR